MSNRCEIKWAPFESLFKTKTVLKELETKRNFQTKPILSDDELQINEQRILSAYHTKNPIKIEYYYQGLCYEKQGIIQDIIAPKILFTDHTFLYFEQILHVSN